MKSQFFNNLAKNGVMVPMLLLALSAYNANAGNTGANSKQPLLITLKMEKVQTSANGKETLTKADKVKPGDLVEYRAVYHNRSKNGIEGLNASLPVPFGMEYVAKSARPATVLASVDGSKFDAVPLLRTVKDKDGKEQQIEVPYPEYRNLRWAIGSLAAGQKVEVSARMHVSALPKSPEELVGKPKPASQLIIK